MGRAAGLLVVLLAAAACAPVPMSMERAEAQCADRARKAAAPTGSVGITVGSGGVDTRVAIGVSGDYLAGRDPQEVYRQCVLRYTGQEPLRPLVLPR